MYHLLFFLLLILLIAQEVSTTPAVAMKAFSKMFGVEDEETKRLKMLREFYKRHEEDLMLCGLMLIVIIPFGLSFLLLCTSLSVYK